MQNYFATLLFPSECLSELRLLEGASCFLSLRDVAGAVMLGWARQPAGTQAGSPGRTAGGPGSLGHRANVKSNRNGERPALGEGRAWGLWTRWVGGVKGASFRTWTGCRPAGCTGSYSNQCPKGCKSLALSWASWRGYGQGWGPVGLLMALRRCGQILVPIAGTRWASCPDQDGRGSMGWPAGIRGGWRWGWVRLEARSLAQSPGNSWEHNSRQRWALE